MARRLLRLVSTELIGENELCDGGLYSQRHSRLRLGVSALTQLMLGLLLLGEMQVSSLLFKVSILKDLS